MKYIKYGLLDEILIFVCLILFTNALIDDDNNNNNDDTERPSQKIYKQKFNKDELNYYKYEISGLVDQFR